MKFPVGPKILAVLALMLLAGVGAISFQSTRRMIDDSRRVEHIHRVLEATEQLLEVIGYDGIRHRGYLITGDETFLAGHAQAVSDARASISRLRDLLNDEPRQLERLDALAAVLTERFKLAESHDELLRNEGFEAVQKRVMTGRGEKMLDDILRLAREISTDESELLSLSGAQSAASARMTQKAIIGGSLLAMALVSAASWKLSRKLFKLRRAEEMFRGLLESAPDAMVIVNREGIITRVNAATERIFGYNRDELLGEPLHILMPERFRERHGDHLKHYFVAPVGRTMGNGMELFALRKNGEEFPVEISLNPLESEEGTLISSAIRDLTDRRHAEDLVREHEQFRGAVLDAIPAEIAVLDAKGEIVAVNEPWLQFSRINGASGLKSSTGVGANYLHICRACHDAEDVAVGIEAVLGGRLQEFHMEYPCHSADQERWFLMHVVRAPAAVGGAIVAHTDITQLKMAEQALRANEELLRTLITAIPDTVQVKDAEGRWIVANEAALRLYHLEKSEWQGKTDLELAAAVALAQAYGLKQCHATDQDMWQLSQPLRALERVPRDDGGASYFDVIKVPLWHPDGRPKLQVVVGRDITTQQHAEEALRNFNAKLEVRVQDRTANLELAMARLRKEINERRRLEEEILKISEREQMRIGLDLHDDLGQQLVGLAMLAQVLSNTLKAESHPGATDAEQIKNCLAVSLNTTRNLTKSFYPAELERGGLILALEDLANRTELLTNVSCIVRAEEGFEIEKTSEIHIYRIVQESISNALKHGRASEIRIDCFTTDAGKTITVTDNGTGFTPQDAENWTGIGLQLFQYRARLINATVTVLPGENGGCQVTCTISRKPPVVEG